METPFKAVLSSADSYLSYVILEPDFHRKANQLTEDGDHYEDGVSPSWRFATRWQEAHLKIYDSRSGGAQ